MNVSKRYLLLRERVLRYSNDDMNLKLDNDRQVYIAVFDIPVKSGIVGLRTQTMALLYGLNAHIYQESGNALTGLEENEKVAIAMQSLFISCPQVLDKMELIEKTEYYECPNVRAYLKTGLGIYFKELTEKTKEERFLLTLMNNVRREIASSL